MRRKPGAKQSHGEENVKEMIEWLNLADETPIRIEWEKLWAPSRVPL